MAEKQLDDSAWKAFAKGRGYKDAGFAKALAAVDSAEKRGPASMIEALQDVDKEAALLRKEHKGDKELAAYLDKVDTAVAKERKAAEALRAKADAASPEDDEDSPAILTTGLIPLMRTVAKGEVVMQALIASTGKEVAVMLARKHIPPARGKLLKQYLGVTGGVKLIAGECLLENKAHTFAVTTQAAGLAKKLKAALLKQTGQRFKVRVRGENLSDIDEDLDDAEPAPVQGAATPQTAAAGPAAGAGAGGGGAAGAPGGPHPPGDVADAAATEPRQPLIDALTQLTKDILALPRTDAVAKLRRMLTQMVESVRASHADIRTTEADKLRKLIAEMNKQVALVRAAPLTAHAVTAERIETRWAAAVQSLNDRARADIAAEARLAPPNAGIDAAALGDALLRYSQTLLRPWRNSVTEAVAGGQETLAGLHYRLQELRQTLAVDPVIAHLGKAPGVGANGLRVALDEAIEATQEELLNG